MTVSLGIMLNNDCFLVPTLNEIKHALNAIKSASTGIKPALNAIKSFELSTFNSNVK